MKKQIADFMKKYQGVKIEMVDGILNLEIKNNLSENEMKKIQEQIQNHDSKIETELEISETFKMIGLFTADGVLPIMTITSKN
jgi:hypothetical protein